MTVFRQNVSLTRLFIFLSIYWLLVIFPVRYYSPSSMTIFGGKSSVEYHLEVPAYLLSCTTSFDDLELDHAYEKICQINFIGMIISAFVLVLGFLLMYKSQKLGSEASIIKFLSFAFVISILMSFVGLISVFANFILVGLR